MPKFKKYEYRWFKPYIVDVVNVGRKTFYKPTVKYYTKSEAYSMGMYSKVKGTKRKKK